MALCVDEAARDKVASLFNQYCPYFPRIGSTMVIHGPHDKPAWSRLPKERLAAR